MITKCEISFKFLATKTSVQLFRAAIFKLEQLTVHRLKGMFKLSFYPRSYCRN